MPRATTAACEVLPPRLVSTPSAAIIPERSSGLVSRRTRTTFSPRSAHRTASSEENTALPTAAPGEAFMPWVSCGGVPAGDEPREHQLRQLVAGDPADRLVHVDEALVDQLGGDDERRGRGARLPTRVCSIQSLLRSTVNSMSHRSR